jgi:hypothetical protein
VARLCLLIFLTVLTVPGDEVCFDTAGPTIFHPENGRSALDRAIKQETAFFGKEQKEPGRYLL